MRRLTFLEREEPSRSFSPDIWDHAGAIFDDILTVADELSGLAKEGLHYSELTDEDGVRGAFQRINGRIDTLSTIQRMKDDLEKEFGDLRETGLNEREMTAAMQRTLERNVKDLEKRVGAKAAQELLRKYLEKS